MLIKSFLKMLMTKISSILRGRSLDKGLYDIYLSSFVFCITNYATIKTEGFYLLLYFVKKLLT